MTEIQNLYRGGDYFNRREDGVGYRDYFADRDLHIKTFVREFECLEKYKRDGELVEVGCAAGFALKVGQDRGWQVSGVEVSKAAAEYACKNFGVSVINSTLAEAMLPDRRFDVVLTYGTIEHLYDPKAFLREAGRIMKDDGILVINTPDIGTWLGDRRFQYKPVEHLYYFDRKTLSRLLSLAGMEIFAYRPFRPIRSARFILERLDYYFGYLSPVWRAMERLFRGVGVLDLCFSIPDGQMVVYARKMRA
jgi:SAM-dependent methyltransferase